MIKERLVFLIYDKKIDKIMKKSTFLIFTIFFLLISCNRSSKSDKYDLNLPSNELMNEVFLSVIRIDSLNPDYSVSKDILIPKVYSFGAIDPDSVSPYTHTMFDELLHSLDSSYSSKQRLDDSVFIVRQIETAKKYYISDNVKSRFNVKSKKSYLFGFPIFNFNKNSVELRYRDNYCDTSFIFHIEILVKENSTWVKKKFRKPNVFE